MLTPQQRRQLLRIARDTITAALEGQRYAVDLASVDEDLQRPAGAFVTLEKHGDLRGCIGSIEPVAPLAQAVSSSAMSAAFRDPRFRPVRADELPQLDIEISVMGPIERVNDVNTIEVGRDGLILSRGSRAGLLLPQVATEYGWDRDTFLRQTCLKAGLPPDAWRAADCRIEKFSAEVFGEQDTAL
ncbi:MAG: AmmeMemoRadiSam system protein A [Acidobacteria bacterium]|nr:AmmeMemoRadiSam system protein A [Acidobacteriota bacterium]MBV9478210.1 AmmeMemoRadiSam system protein A [Acidobacteriota bacterium]